MYVYGRHRGRGPVIRRLLRGSEWRREVLRTNLWLVPAIEVVGAAMLFAVHLRARPGGLRRRVQGARLGDQRVPGRRQDGADRDRGRCHHGRRRGVLDRDRRADADVHPVRPADAAQLHPRPRHSADPGHVRGHVRLRGADARLGRPGRARELRAAHQRHDDAGADGGRPGRAYLLPAPHRHPDPAAAGDRRDRR